jgi:hypothetical protein
MHRGEPLHALCFPSFPADVIFYSPKSDADSTRVQFCMKTTNVLTLQVLTHPGPNCHDYLPSWLYSRGRYKSSIGSYSKICVDSQSSLTQKVVTAVAPTSLSYHSLSTYLHFLFHLAPTPPLAASGLSSSASSLLPR